MVHLGCFFSIRSKEIKSWKLDNFGYITDIHCEKMTLYQFNLLDKTKQAEAVWSGVHIDNRQDDQHNILLYEVDGFYVEVFYHRIYNVIVKFRSFSSTTQLAPYLEKFDILDLIK
jgi:hypothetical protein